MNEEKKSFLVYHDIKPILDKLPDEKVGTLFRAMVNYSVERAEPRFDDFALEIAFIPIQQQLDRNMEKWDEIKEKRAEAGRKGGLKTAELRREASQANEANATFASSASEANEANQANQAVKVKVKVKGKVKGKGEGKVSADGADDPLSLSERIISYLNEKTGSQYRPTTATAKIQGLLDQGYTEADMRMVIDKKCADWLDDDNMREHLRPSTLFRADKFEEYLNAPVSLKLEKKQKQTSSKAKLEKQLQEKTEALAVIRDSIESMKDEDGRVRENITEYRALKEQAAILEDTIGQIENRLRIN